MNIATVRDVITWATDPEHITVTLPADPTAPLPTDQTELTDLANRLLHRNDTPAIRLHQPATAIDDALLRMHPHFGDNYTHYTQQYGYEETEDLYDVDLILDTDATTLITSLCILLNTKPFWMPQDTWNDRDNDVYLDLDTVTFVTGANRNRNHRHVYSQLLGTNESYAVRRPDNWSDTPPATPGRDYTRTYRDTARRLLTAPITTHVIPAAAEDILALAPHTTR